MICFPEVHSHGPHLKSQVCCNIVGIGQESKRRPCTTCLCLNIIKQVYELLNKLCSVLLPWQIYLLSVPSGQRPPGTYLWCNKVGWIDSQQGGRHHTQWGTKGQQEPSKDLGLCWVIGGEFKEAWLSSGLNGCSKEVGG